MITELELRHFRPNCEFIRIGGLPGEVMRMRNFGNIWVYDWTKCAHESADMCDQRCTRRCGRVSTVLPFCLVHMHCNRCGAIECHGGWWRFKSPDIAHKAQEQQVAAEGAER